MGAPGWREIRTIAGLYIDFIHWVIIVLFGIYAFKNPEKNIECYVSDIIGSSKTLHPIVLLGADYMHDYIDKAKNSVFIGGFVLKFIHPLSVAVGLFIIKWSFFENIMNPSMIRIFF